MKTSPADPGPLPLGTSGWVLTALYHAGPVRRADPVQWSLVIAAADWINHAVLSFDELHTGVRDLGARHLLRERAGVISLTPGAWTAFVAAYGARKRMSVFKLWAAAEILIAQRKPGTSTLEGPTRSVFRRAVEAYHRRMSGARG